MRNSSMGPLFRIDQMTHCTASGCSTMELHLTSVTVNNVEGRKNHNNAFCIDQIIYNTELQHDIDINQNGQKSK